MGTKDFTDWNGRKRKEALYPSKDKPVRRQVVKKRDKPAGLKTKVDRYKARLTTIKRYWEWRRNHQLRMRGRADTGMGAWNPRWEDDIRREIRFLREMEEDYKKQGIWDRVLKALKGF